MKGKWNGLAIALSIAALVVALFDLRPQRIVELVGGNSSRETLETTTVERVVVRVEELEEENAVLRELLRETQSILDRVEETNAVAVDRVAEVDHRVIQLAQMTQENTRAVVRLDSTLMSSQGTLETTDASKQAQDEGPSLEDYVRVELDPINGVPGPHVIVEGANLHVRSGGGSTNDLGAALGLGNLIVGYNEIDPAQVRPRGGSHNVVIGAGHGYTSYGGLVAGLGNEIAAPGASVTGGMENTAVGLASAVSGGEGNRATGESASVAGGVDNEAIGRFAVVAAGSQNLVEGLASSIAGGRQNTAIGDYSAVSGGAQNSAMGELSSVTGGITEVNTMTGGTLIGQSVFPPTGTL